MAPSGGVAARADTNTSSKAAMKWNEMLQNRTSGASPEKEVRTPEISLSSCKIVSFFFCGHAKEFMF